MKIVKLLPIALFLILVGCLDSSSTSYDDTEDLAFLDEYAQRSGVITTNSGLMYRVIQEGNDQAGSPAAHQYSIIKYKYESVDEFYKEDTEDDFLLIKPENMSTFTGIGEGVQLMNEGARFEFVLPTNLATNDGRAYIFEVHLESYLRNGPEQFLTDNKELEGIETTDSGLQYRVLEEGDGASPGPSSTVSIKYKGAFTSGYVFDQTSGDETAELSVNGVIPGFSEGLQLMKEGSKYEFFIPPALGYQNGHLLYGVVLIFEVELLEIQ